MLRPGLILLAAGGSTRLGRPKQLIPWGGSNLLRHAVEIALQTECRPVLVVLGCQADICQEALGDLPVTTVINGDWKKGLGSSVAAGIQRMEVEAPDTPGVLIMLADQPTLTPALLGSLIAHWSPPSRAIVAALYGKEGGVPALFDRSFFPELRALNRDRGARELIAREKEHTALVDLGGNLIDIDTPEDYRRHQPL